MVKGEMGMARYPGYGKPNMAALPNDELGRAIIRQILNTPPPDRERLRKEAAEIEARIIAARNSNAG